MITFIGFRFFFIFIYGAFYLNKFIWKKIQKFFLLYLKSTKLTSSTYFNLKTRLCIKHVLHKTAIPQIHLWVVFIVKTTISTDSPLIIFIQFKKTNKKNKKKRGRNKKTNKKYVHAYVSWFGAFHELTVPGFIYGCMVQFPVDTQLSATKL